MLNHVVNVGWTVWWHLTDRERIEIEWAWRRSAFYSYRDDPKRLWAFIQRAIALNTGHSLAVAAVLIDLAGHRMQHEGFRAALHVAKGHPFERCTTGSWPLGPRAKVS
jgi:hypothetical protein